MKKGKIAVLISGRGSNLQAIHKNSLKKSSRFQICLVCSDNPQAPGLDYARLVGLKTIAFDPKDFPTKKEYEQKILSALQSEKIDLVCLAGYMRLVGNTLLNAYNGKIMNIHPSLLPAFPGLNAQKQAIDYGVRISGCTVHFVDSSLDGGPIILQQAVNIKPDDDENTLAARILQVEHRIYSRAINLFFANRLVINGRRVEIVKKS